MRLANRNPLNPASLAANGKQGARAKDSQATSGADHTANRANGYAFKPRECLLIAASHLEAARTALEAHACQRDGIGEPLPYRPARVARLWPMPSAPLCAIADALDLYCADLSAILAGGGE